MIQHTENPTTPLAPIVVPAPGVVELARVEDRRERRFGSADRDVTVIARNRDELRNAQADLIDWARAQLEDAERELADAEAVVAHAKAAGVDHRPSMNLRRRAQRRFFYFDKLLAAFQAGYTVMPAMPGATVLAVRTAKAAPSECRMNETTSWRADRVLVAPEGLPRGTGQYVDEQPEQSETTWEAKDADGAVKKWRGVYTTGRHRPPMLPTELCRPRIVEAFDKAMQLGVFDQIAAVGVAPRAGTDPILAGLIHHHASKAEGWAGAFHGRAAWFLLAWWIDTESLR